MITTPRLMQIVASLEVGGLESLVVEMTRAAQQSQFRSIICALGGGETALSRRAVDHGVPVVFLNERGEKSWLQVLAALVGVVRRERIDVLHSHNAVAHVIGASLSLATRKPLVHTKHGDVLPFDGFKATVLNRVAGLVAAELVAVSKQIERTIIEEYGIHPDKVTTIINGIDVAQHTSCAGPAGTDTVGAVGRLSEEKDYPTLLRAFRLVLERRPETTLLIIGGGSLREDLASEARRLGIDERVQFLGLRHDVPQLLAQLDLFVLSSVTEGISLSLLQAMASGLPVVATAVGGNPEVVIDGESGYLVPPGVPTALAEKICAVLGDRALARRLGQRGRRRAQERFSIERMVAEYQRVYLEAMSTRPMGAKFWRDLPRQVAWRRSTVRHIDGHSLVNLDG